MRSYRDSSSTRASPTNFQRKRSQHNMADFATSHVLHREPITGDRTVFPRPAVRTFSLSNAKTFAPPQDVAARRKKFSIARRITLFLADLALVNVTYHLALAVRFGTFMPITGAPSNAAAWSVRSEEHTSELQSR